MMSDRVKVETVTARLLDGSGYTVGAGSDSSSMVTVQDDDGPSPPPGGTPEPEVTITAGPTPVEEGDPQQPVVFTLTASPTPAAPLTVNVSWSDSGDRLKDPPPGTVTIPTNGSATLSLETEDDMTVEPESVVTATIDSGTGYTLGTPDSADRNGTGR